MKETSLATIASESSVVEDDEFDALKNTLPSFSSNNVEKIQAKEEPTAKFSIAEDDGGISVSSAPSPENKSLPAAENSAEDTAISVGPLAAATSDSADAPKQEMADVPSNLDSVAASLLKKATLGPLLVENPIPSPKGPQQRKILEKINSDSSETNDNSSSRPKSASKVLEESPIMESTRSQSLKGALSKSPAATGSALKRPGSRPGSSNRVLRPSSAGDDNVSNMLKQHQAATRIQNALRNYVRRKKFIKSNKNLSVLRADSLLRIIDSTRDEVVIEKAFSTSIEVQSLLLAKKSVNRALELLAKYFKSSILFPVDTNLMVECVRFFAEKDKNLVDKGFDALSAVIKLKPEKLLEDNPEWCDLIVRTLSLYPNDALLCFKATKCLYRMCDKNERNRLSFGQIEGCLTMKNLFEIHLKNTSLMENLAKCVINMCIDCTENQAMLGEVGLCDAVFAAFIEHMSFERLFYLLCRSIINLCAGNLRANQDRMGKGVYPSVLIKAVTAYKAFPKAMEQIITCILSIVANNKGNKQRFQEAGTCEVLLDLIAIAPDPVILSNCFWAISTILTATGL